MTSAPRSAVRPLLRRPHAAARRALAWLGCLALVVAAAGLAPAAFSSCSKLATGGRWTDATSTRSMPSCVSIGW